MQSARQRQGSWEAWTLVFPERYTSCPLVLAVRPEPADIRVVVRRSGIGLSVPLL